jgi:DNA-binding NarL/FixJ family response regulator
VGRRSTTILNIEKSGPRTSSPNPRLKIRIVLADDHVLVREGLKELLRSEPTFEIVGEAGTAAQTVLIVSETQPDILLLDLSLPDLHGTEVLRQVQDRSRTRTIILTMFDNAARVIDTLRHGASGYVLKDSAVAELIEAIRAVANGDQYLSEKIRADAMSACIKDFVPGKRRSKLTDREFAVMELAASDKTSLEIAESLSISRRTAEAHRANLMKKLGLRTQTDLVLFATLNGIVLHKRCLKGWNVPE